jgi:hypothetical protein
VSSLGHVTISNVRPAVLAKLARASFLIRVEGQSVLNTAPNGITSRPKGGSDGIALSGDHKYLYFCPLYSRHLFRVDAAALANPDATEEQVATTVKDLGEKGMSDGMESDDERPVNKKPQRLESSPSREND